MAVDRLSVPLTRRSFLVAASLAATSCVGLSRSDPASLGARRKAAWRKRPLILDDDGDLVYADETLKGPEAFLSLRMHDCLAAGVDSLAWCMMWAIAQKGETPVRYWQTQMENIPFQENMPDPTPVVADFCRKHGIEVFGSLRMNDAHDAFGMPFPKLVYPLKVKHPEMLLGDESHRGEPSDGLAAAMWSGMDYAHEKVRNDRLWWIEHTAERYGLDGVDLNFFRMPFYFKRGEDEKNAPLMTDLIRQGRKRIDAISRKLGRPVLLGVRVPGTIEVCQRIGLDIETWLREGLVDRMLTGGGYVCYSTPAEELVKLGHRFEVPVYPCINCPANYIHGGNNLRGAASNFWASGADGIYLWNFQYIVAPGRLGYGRPAREQYTKLLPEIADPKRLTYLDKSFAVNVRVWEQYQRASAMPPLPISLGGNVGGNGQMIPVRIGDDVAAAFRAGKVRDVVLKLRAAGSVHGDILSVTLNDAQAKRSGSSGDNQFASPLDPRAIRQGVNQLTLGLAKRAPSATKEISVESARVDVRYR